MRQATIARHAAACERVARHIDSHPEAPLTARQMADLAYLSENHLQRAYLASTGTTMGDHLRLRRIERAAQLLIARPGLSLAAVAREAGLASAPVLVHLFQRELGTTPGQFRRAEALTRLPRAAPLQLPKRYWPGSRVEWCAPLPVLIHTQRGVRARGFSHAGFAAADRALAEFLRLWPGAAVPRVLALYPDASLSPDDPTSRQVIALPIPSTQPTASPDTGFALQTLPGGWYLRVPTHGTHGHAWQAWQRLARSDAFAPLELTPRDSAWAFESCEGFAGQGAARERVGTQIWLPAHRIQADTYEKLAQAEADAAGMPLLSTPQGSLLERLLAQPG